MTQTTNTRRVNKVVYAWIIDNIDYLKSNRFSADIVSLRDQGKLSTWLDWLYLPIGPDIQPIAGLTDDEINTINTEIAAQIELYS